VGLTYAGIALRAVDADVSEFTMVFFAALELLVL